MFPVLFAAIFGYLLGSIPFGLVITRLAGLEDIRKIGSGNIGATNVLRTGHRWLALLTLLCDAGKAGFVAFVCRFLFDSETIGVLAGFMAVIGHNYPVWLHFKGGKGVASTLGMMLVISFPVGALTCLTWLLMFGLFRYSSLSALTALCLSPFYAFFLSSSEITFCCAVLALLSCYRHRSNISRLIRGEESKFKSGRK